jgi:hypothetical protein
MATPAEQGSHDRTVISGITGPTYEDDHRPAARLRRNPGGWGVSLGSGVVLVSLFLVWIEVTNHATGATDRVRAIASFSGQTLFLMTLLGAGIGAGISLVSSNGWRVALAAAALLLGAAFAGAGLWAILDPAGFTKHAADAQLFASSTAAWHARDTSDRLAAAFASGKVTASAGIGAYVGLAGGLLCLVGALFAFGRRAPSV